MQNIKIITDTKVKFKSLFFIKYARKKGSKIDSIIIRFFIIVF